MGFLHRTYVLEIWRLVKCCRVSVRRLGHGAAVAALRRLPAIRSNDETNVVVVGVINSSCAEAVAADIYFGETRLQLEMSQGLGHPIRIIYNCLTTPLHMSFVLVLWDF